MSGTAAIGSLQPAEVTKKSNSNAYDTGTGGRSFGQRAPVPVEVVPVLEIRVAVVVVVDIILVVVVVVVTVVDGARHGVLSTCNVPLIAAQTLTGIGWHFSVVVVVVSVVVVAEVVVAEVVVVVVEYVEVVIVVVVVDLVEVVMDVTVVDLLHGSRESTAAAKTLRC